MRSHDVITYNINDIIKKTHCFFISLYITNSIINNEFTTFIKAINNDLCFC